MSDSYGMQRWVSFYNDSGETIPSYALLMLTSDYNEPDTTVNFSKRLRAKKYVQWPTGNTTEGEIAVYAFNSRSPVLPDKYGECTFAIDGPAWARFKDTEWDYESLDLSSDFPWTTFEVGPLDDKWSLGVNGQCGYRMLTRPQQLEGTDYHRALVIAVQRSPRKVTLDENMFHGNRDGGGVAMEGTVHGDNLEDTTVYFDDYPKLIVPGFPFWVEWTPRTKNWIPVQGGQTHFKGVTLEDINPTGDVEIDTGSSRGPRLKCEQPITGEPVPSGVTVTVDWDSVLPVARITGIACPVDTLTP